jgi:multicomponent Na+:H+ antiporter subunit A
MVWVLGAHVLAAVAAAVLAPRLGRHVFWLCALAPLAGVVWLLAAGDSPADQRIAWVPDLGLTFTFRVDGFARLMGLVVTGIGVLVFAYAVSYFDGDHSSGKDLQRFAPTLTLFAGAMLGIVTSDDVLTLFVFWELTSITSYALIGFDHEQPAARSSALQALLTTGLGGLALLGGLVLLAQEAGTTRLSEIVAASPSGPVVNAGLVLITIAACTKSAQVPFHTWLPRAMAAPTPVSAYLHSATMVKAGVFLLARFTVGFADETWWTTSLVVIGLSTMLVGGVRALRADDLKQVLAFGTIGQLGFLVVLFGVGEPAVTTAGAVMLVAHALFKAPLFMSVGMIDHGVHQRDLTKLSGIGAAMPALATVALVAAASMAGLPPLAGFVGKEKAFDVLLDHPWALAGVVAGSILTVAYTARSPPSPASSRPTTRTPRPQRSWRPLRCSPSCRSSSGPHRDSGSRGSTPPRRRSGARAPS